MVHQEIYGYLLTHYALLGVFTLSRVSWRLACSKTPALRAAVHARWDVRP